MKPFAAWSRRDTSHGARDRARSSPRPLLRNSLDTNYSYTIPGIDGRSRRSADPGHHDHPGLRGGGGAAPPGARPTSSNSDACAPPTTDPPSSPSTICPRTSSMRNATAKRSAAPSTPCWRHSAIPSATARPSSRQRARIRGSPRSWSLGTSSSTSSRSTSTAPAVGSCSLERHVPDVIELRVYRPGSRHRGGALALVAGRIDRRSYDADCHDVWECRARLPAEPSRAPLRQSLGARADDPARPPGTLGSSGSATPVRPVRGDGLVRAQAVGRPPHPGRDDRPRPTAHRYSARSSVARSIARLAARATPVLGGRGDVPGPARPPLARRGVAAFAPPSMPAACP